MLSTLPRVKLNGLSALELGIPPEERAELWPRGPVPEFPLDPVGGTPQGAAEPESAGPAWERRVLADVAPESVNWLCPSVLPRGRLTVFVGESGVGKSYLAADLAARLSKFTCPLPRRDEAAPSSGPPIRVLWAAQEESPGRLHVRLSELKANLDRIAVLTPAVEAVPAQDAAAGCGDASISAARPPETAQSSVRLPLAAADLRDALADAPRCDLVVVDGLRADPLDRAAQAELESVLTELDRLAAEADVALVLIWRSGTGVRARRAVAALADLPAVSTLWDVVRDPADWSLRLLAPVKWNLAADPLPMGFRIENGRLQWQRMACDPRSRHTSERQSAAQWLRQQLADCPLPVHQLKEQAIDCGFSLRTLRRAREDLELKAVYQSDGIRFCWHWQLTTAEADLISPYPPIWESDETFAEAGYPLDPEETIQPVNSLGQRSPRFSETGVIAATPDLAQCCTASGQVDQVGQTDSASAAAGEPSENGQLPTVPLPADPAGGNPPSKDPQPDGVETSDGAGTAEPQSPSGAPTAPVGQPGQGGQGDQGGQRGQGGQVGQRDHVGQHDQRGQVGQQQAGGRRRSAARRRRARRLLANAAK